MPRPHPPEFRQRAIELVRLGEEPISRIATDLGISDSCLRGWVKQDDLDTGRRDDGLSTKERDELVELRRQTRNLKLENEILKRAAAYFTKENVLPKMMYTFIAEACPDLPVRVCCRVMGVSPSGFYQRRNQPVTNTELDDAIDPRIACCPQREAALGRWRIDGI